MRNTLALFAAILLAAPSPLHAAPPNIIFILLDDFGWGDMHCYGHPYAKTPNMDRLASEGIRFLQCYATGVTCCPSRTGFMTSKFPATFAKYPANGGFADRITISELLKKRGYATGHFGKWHIGPEAKPGIYGFDVVGGSDAEKETRSLPGVIRGSDAPIYDRAVEFIEKHRNDPFYVNIWDHIPHHPVNPSPEIIEAFGALNVDQTKFPRMQEKFANCEKMGGDVSRHMRAYLSQVKAVDDEIGALLQRLDQLGLRENTIVAISSDQGPAPISEERINKSANAALHEAPLDEKTRKRAANNSVSIRLNAMGCAGPFRGGKTEQYEGGVRIPFIVRWPGKAPEGRVDEQSVISGADWLPTLCAITETNCSESEFDGEDASIAFLGRTFTRTKPLLWQRSSPKHDGAIRVDRWKLHQVNVKRGEFELFDMAVDPGETANVATKHPDVVRRLAATLEAWQATLPKEYDRTNDADN